MIYNTLRVVVVAAALTISCDAMAQGCAGCGGETNGNGCGRGITQMEAASLWSNYCTDDCATGAGSRCGGGLFHRHRGGCGGGCGLFGGGNTGNCGCDSGCGAVATAAPVADACCDSGCGSKFGGRLRGRFGGGAGCGCSGGCDVGGFGYPSGGDCGGCDTGCDNGCGFGARLRGMGNRIGGCGSCAPVADDCCNDGCGSRLRGYFGRRAEANCGCEDLCGCDSGCGGKLRGLFSNLGNRGCGCEEVDPCGCEEVDPCGCDSGCGGKLRAKFAGLFHRHNCGDPCGYFNQCGVDECGNGGMQSCVSGCGAMPTTVNGSVMEPAAEPAAATDAPASEGN